MSSGGKIRVAIVGLGFGAEFIPIYQRHPNAEMYALCRRDRKELDACGDRFGVKTRYTDYTALLADPNVDAVHINSPIADHAPQSIAALKAGKHVASTVPAATTVAATPAITHRCSTFKTVSLCRHRPSCHGRTTEPCPRRRASPGTRGRRAGRLLPASRADDRPGQAWRRPTE